MLRSILALGGASAWMIAGRGAGLVWTLVVISMLGIEDYGRYASAYALAAIISAPLENVFVVRCVRVDENQYLGERTTRFSLGALLLIGAVVIYPMNFIIGFALLIAGAEMIFNAYKSIALRAGRPGSILRVDAIRQYASIAAASAYLLVAGSQAELEIACLVYAAPYLVVVIVSGFHSLRHKPLAPGGLRENLILLVDAFVISLYLQGDILLLGVLAGDEVVGVYSLASQVALAASSIGQIYGQTFSRSLRDHNGHPDAGPVLRTTLALGALFFVGTVLVGAVLLLLVPQYHDLGATLLVISLFTGLRTIDNAWVTVLYVQGKDVPRVAWSALALVVKLGILALLVPAGAPGALVAAGAAVAGEIVVFVAYRRLMRSPVPSAQRGHVAGRDGTGTNHGDGSSGDDGVRTTDRAEAGAE